MIAVQLRTGHVSLGFAGSTVFHPMVATVMQRYRNTYPRVVISCEESNSSVLLERVAERRVDAALVRLPLHCGDLVVEPLVEEDMLAVLPTNHRLTRRRRIDLADLWRTTRSFFSLGRLAPICMTPWSARAVPPGSRPRSA